MAWLDTQQRQNVEARKPSVNKDNANLNQIFQGGTQLMGAVSSLITPTAGSVLADTTGEETAMQDIGSGDISKISDFSALKNYASQANATNTQFNSRNWLPDESAQRVGAFMDTFNTSYQGGQAMSNMIGGFGGNDSASGIAGVVGAGVFGLAKGIKDAVEISNAYKKADERAEYLNQLGQANINRSFAKTANQSTNIMGVNAGNVWASVAAQGGPLYTNSNFSNGVRFIENGGSHEQNPFGGVLQGIAMDGLPNLVEEGEVIYNDYVYSKRLKVPNKDKESLGLKKDKDYTYAEAAEYVQRESEERPNDVLSKKNLDSMMSRLQESQETLKEKREEAKFRNAINKMTPDELGMFMQQLQQPQAMQPMMGMQPMQPMQATQSEVPMFAKGGLLGHIHATDGNLNTFNFHESRDGVTDSGILVDESGNPIFEGDWDYNKPDTDFIFETDEQGRVRYKKLNRPALDYGNRIVYDSSIGGYKVVVPTTSEDKYYNVNTFADALRAMPILGNTIGAIAALNDIPDYSNIARAERAMARVPYVGTKPLGNRLAYTPIDFNYIANAQTNAGLGARRAAQEYSAGNRAVAMNNFAAATSATQKAIGEGLLQAMQENEKRRQVVAEFNRGTDQYNSTQFLDAAKTNQALDMQKADFLFRTGQLRNAERDAVQLERSQALSNLFNSIGDYGYDTRNANIVENLARNNVFGAGAWPIVTERKRTTTKQKG